MWLTPQRPNHEPSCSCSSSSQRRPSAALSRASCPASAASSSTACAVTSALGGSITSPKSQNGTSRGSVRVLSTSNAPQPPSAHCIPISHSTASSTAVVDALGIGMAGAAQGQRDHRGVVDVGVVDVRVLERPTAAGQVRPPHGPVAGDVGDLTVKQPLGRAHERRIAGLQAGVGQRDQRQRGVPHRRLARLQPSLLGLLDGERVEAVEAGAHHRMVERIPLQVKRHQRVHPRRLDPAPAAVGLLALDDPALGRAQAQPPQRPHRVALVDAQHLVHRGQRAGGQRLRRDGARRRARAELVQRDPERPHRAVGAHDRQRDDRLPGPAGEVVWVQRKPGRQEHHLGRQRGNVVPRPQPEQRHPDVREHARSPRSAAGAGPLGGTRHVRLGRIVAGHAQRPVGLDRRRQFARAAGEVRPASVLRLVGPDPGRRAAATLVGADPQELAQQQVLGIHRHVGGE